MPTPGTTRAPAPGTTRAPAPGTPDFSDHERTACAAVLTALQAKAAGDDEFGADPGGDVRLLLEGARTAGGDTLLDTAATLTVLAAALAQTFVDTGSVTIEDIRKVLLDGLSGRLDTDDQAA